MVLSVLCDPGCVFCDVQVVRSRADAKRELLQVQQKAAKALTILRNSFQVNGVKKTLSVTYDHPPDPPHSWPSVAALALCQACQRPERC